MPQSSEFYTDISKEIVSLLGAEISSINRKTKVVYEAEEEEETPKVVIYTDGSWKHQVQAGGWCALLTWKDQWKMVTDSQYNTTINRMELSAVINALRLLKVPCEVTVISDSQLTVNTINYFIKLWKKNNFVSSKGKEIANRDLIDQLIVLMDKHRVKAKWVKAHTGQKDPISLANDVCDYFAQKSVDRLAHKPITKEGVGYGCEKLQFRGKKRAGKKHRKRR